MSVTSRLGLFFVVIGIALIVLYVISDTARMSMCSLLIAGIAATIFGIGLWRKGMVPKEPSQRFTTLKRIMTATSKNKKGDKSKKP